MSIDKRTGLAYATKGSATANTAPIGMRRSMGVRCRMESLTYTADADVSSRTRLMEDKAETRSDERRADITEKATTKRWTGVKSHERGEGRFPRKPLMIEADVTSVPDQRETRWAENYE